VSSDRISPTAHCTGHVWARGGLSHPELATLEGRILFDSLQPAMLASRVIRGPAGGGRVGSGSGLANLLEASTT
jgi:hypothetical protein